MSTFCSQEVLTLATGIWQDLNSPSATSVAYISGVLLSSGFLGAINSRLTIDLWVSGGACIAGGFGAQEQNIASLQFQHDYCRRKAMEVMQGVGAGWAGSVTQIKEADSSVSRESPSKAAAEWRHMAKEAQEDLHVAVANWKVGHCMPVDVQFAPPSAWPTP